MMFAPGVAGCYTAMAAVAKQGPRYRLPDHEAPMPSRPPGLKAKPKALVSRWNRKQTTTQRGYGWRHQQMRNRVLAEEPLCRMCLAMNPPRYTPSTIADHIVPKAEGGTDDRENYQGLDDECHAIKTAQEAARARRR